MAEKVDIIELLLKKKIISDIQLAEAKEETKRTGLTLSKALEKLGFITEENIAKLNADALGLPYVNLEDYLIDSELIKIISENVARKYKVIPLFKIANNLTIGMVNPQDILALDAVRKLCKLDAVEPVLVTEYSLNKVLDSYFGNKGSVNDMVTSSQFKQSEAEEGIQGESLIKLVNLIITQAAKDKASDIHIEPGPDILRIRYRVDGILHETNTLPKKLQSAIISRIKLLSDMDIAESRKPQDGRIRLKLDNRDLDIRVSTFPTVHGENIVMRLLDKSSVLLGLQELGFVEGEFKKFEKFIYSPHGIILVTGPTGSGKTTTLYAALSTINTIEKNIITIEDPVEYELPLIRQTQVNQKAGITFATGLRSILRQDPDIIMLGEVRDKETVEVTIQAALTGHLVFSTLHTNDAAAALSRLIDMGIEPFLVSSSVIAILAQRLVRTICEKCKEKYVPEMSVLKDLGLKTKKTFYRGKGCKHCNKTGFSGRLGVFELLLIDEKIRTMINEKKSADQITKVAQAAGMKSLFEDGLEKALKGLTTIDEVLRVSKIDG
ncbi:MAG: ATPase, T2SS/T4P/T4SS family [Candidatus Omnitrophica bacterium]|nr:ATPase, T2SS/T4P/T4SS family [Candidatus Omnitrophota bacterium]